MRTDTEAWSKDFSRKENGTRDESVVVMVDNWAAFSYVRDDVHTKIQKRTS